MNEEEIKSMVDAFLTWPLPLDVCADGVACKLAVPGRTGTNLLTAAQARAMVEHVCAEPMAFLRSDAARDVLTERRRQVEAEGWTPEHDDEHGNGELSQAAGCYALYAGLPDSARVPAGFAPMDWPWETHWWKPSPDQRRNLVKAAALLLAEIERLDRASMIDSRNHVDLPTDQGCA